jgi:hypothetical protein
MRGTVAEASVAQAPAVIRKTPDEVNRGVAEAFFAARDGYPVDRVIADPEMNAQFIEACRRLGVPGEPKQWNHRLFNHRKAGYLKGLPPGRKTTFPLEEAEFERYKYACEIAIQKYSVEGKSFDDILCDPDLARGFDETVLSMIPEALTSLKIRWYAFRLRKRAAKYRLGARNLGKPINLPRNFENPFTASLGKVPEAPGLYWLKAANSHLYVGEARNLRERFKLQFRDTRFDFWANPLGTLEVGYRAVDTQITEITESNQSVWVAQWKPERNWEQLGKDWNRRRNPSGLALAS